MLTHKGTRPLETPLIILRRFVPEDARAMYNNWASCPETTKFLTWPAHSNIGITQKVLEDWVQNYEKDTYYQWAIVWKQTMEPIGSIAVVSLDNSTEKAEIGYCIGKNWWHRGIMTQAVQAVIGYLFTEVGINRIQARHDPRNPHSGAVMQKSGMTYEGTLRQSDRNNQGICDASYYAILRQDYNKGGNL